jgi:hypothetical protein
MKAQFLAGVLAVTGTDLREHVGDEVGCDVFGAGVGGLLCQKSMDLMANALVVVHGVPKAQEMLGLLDRELLKDLLDEDDLAFYYNDMKRRRSLEGNPDAWRSFMVCGNYGLVSIMDTTGMFARVAGDRLAAACNRKVIATWQRASSLYVDGEISAGNYVRCLWAIYQAIGAEGSKAFVDHMYPLGAVSLVSKYGEYFSSLLDEGQHSGDITYTALFNPPAPWELNPEGLCGTGKGIVVSVGGEEYLYPDSVSACDGVHELYVVYKGHILARGPILNEILESNDDNCDNIAQGGAAIAAVELAEMAEVAVEGAIAAEEVAVVAETAAAEATVVSEGVSGMATDLEGEIAQNDSVLEPIEESGADEVARAEAEARMSVLEKLWNGTNYVGTNVGRLSNAMLVPLLLLGSMGQVRDLFKKKDQNDDDWSKREREEQLKREAYESNAFMEGNAPPLFIAIKRVLDYGRISGRIKYEWALEIAGAVAPMPHRVRDLMGLSLDDAYTVSMQLFNQDETQQTQEYMRKLAGQEDVTMYERYMLAKAGSDVDKKRVFRWADAGLGVYSDITYKNEWVRGLPTNCVVSHTLKFLKMVDCVYTLSPLMPDLTNDQIERELAAGLGLLAGNYSMRNATAAERAELATYRNAGRWAVANYHPSLTKSGVEVVLKQTTPGLRERVVYPYPEESALYTGLGEYPCDIDINSIPPPSKRIDLPMVDTLGFGYLPPACHEAAIRAVAYCPDPSVDKATHPEVVDYRKKVKPSGIMTTLYNGIIDSYLRHCSVNTGIITGEYQSRYMCEYVAGTELCGYGVRNCTCNRCGRMPDRDTKRKLLAISQHNRELHESIRKEMLDLVVDEEHNGLAQVIPEVAAAMGGHLPGVGGLIYDIIRRLW